VCYQAFTRFFGLQCAVRLGSRARDILWVLPPPTAMWSARTSGWPRLARARRRVKQHPGPYFGAAKGAGPGNGRPLLCRHRPWPGLPTHWYNGRPLKFSVGHGDFHPGSATPDKPSIAVLPFESMSSDPDQQYFADGVVEQIITAPSRFSSLFVIARNSSFTYRGRTVDVKQVGRELGVRYVLKGSVRRGGDRTRIIGQLIDAASGAHLWADRFEGDSKDIFDLQDQVAANVVGAIAPRLERAEIERPSENPLKASMPTTTISGELRASIKTRAKASIAPCCFLGKLLSWTRHSPPPRPPPRFAICDGKRPAGWPTAAKRSARLRAWPAPPLP
jgi:TolB-like protein